MAFDLLIISLGSSWLSTFPLKAGAFGLLLPSFKRIDAGAVKSPDVSRGCALCGLTEGARRFAILKGQRKDTGGSRKRRNLLKRDD
ncbi:MAG: hypothetical protein C4567_17840 [Deltaproteobacteria bacterium]|nr:MAG: hypothetical protein C4567_17840 [Deltaproteobacteria bacterium]